MAAKKGKVSQEAVDELVKRYLLDKIRAQAGEDEDLLDDVLAIHELASQHEKGNDPSKRLRELRDSPMIRTAMAFLGERFRKLADVGVRLAEDTQTLRTTLRKRLADEGIDPADPKQLAAAEAEYERVLVETVPLDTALENVTALADMVDLANDVLNQEGLKRHAYEAAWKVGKRILFDDDRVLASMESVKQSLQGDKTRLTRISRLIRKVGPGVVRDAYKRGARAAGAKATAGGKGAKAAGKAVATKTAAKKSSKRPADDEE